MPDPPSPGDDATPFLLRCFAAPGGFRPLIDFESSSGPTQDEHKLYVWKTTTLRELAQMLHESNPALSQALSLHSFRAVRYDRGRRQCHSRPLGAGITRVPLEEIQHSLEGIQLDAPTSRAMASLSQQVDERAASSTVADLALGEDERLDCAVKPDPPIPSAPAGHRFAHGAGAGGGGGGGGGVDRGFAPPRPRHR